MVFNLMQVESLHWVSTFIIYKRLRNYDCAGLKNNVSLSELKKKKKETSGFLLEIQS